MKLKPIAQELEYGTIKCYLDKIMKERDISTYELSNQANIRFQTVQNLRKDVATRIDFNVLSKLCFVLNLKVEDILEHIEK